jgi:hypothetical protein
MAEPGNPPGAGNNHVEFTSDDDFVEIWEKDTKPGGKVSESYKKRLAEKYGIPYPPPPKPPGEANNT